MEGADRTATLADERATGNGHPTFGTALAGALRARGTTQHGLGRSLGIGQSTISAWVADRAIPSHAVVFRVEQSLDLAPGALSRHLGYLPVDAAVPSTVLECLAIDPALTEGQRAALRAVYEELIRLPD